MLTVAVEPHRVEAHTSSTPRDDLGQGPGAADRPKLAENWRSGAREWVQRRHLLTLREEALQNANSGGNVVDREMMCINAPLEVKTLHQDELRVALMGRFRDELAEGTTSSSWEADSAGMPVWGGEVNLRN
jgi:hypothetical protein